MPDCTIAPGNGSWIEQGRRYLLRQNYNRLARNLVCQQSRYAHARQMKRARAFTRKLKFTSAESSAILSVSVVNLMNHWYLC